MSSCNVSWRNMSSCNVSWRNMSSCNVSWRNMSSCNVSWRQVFTTLSPATLPRAHAACSRIYSAGERRSSTKIGTALAWMTARVCREVPDTIFVSAHAASNCSFGCSGICKNWTNLFTTPDRMTRSIGGFFSRDSSLRSCSVALLDGGVGSRAGISQRVDVSDTCSQRRNGRSGGVSTRGCHFSKKWGKSNVHFTRIRHM